MTIVISSMKVNDGLNLYNSTSMTSTNIEIIPSRPRLLLEKRRSTLEELYYGQAFAICSLLASGIQIIVIVCGGGSGTATQHRVIGPLDHAAIARSGVLVDGVKLLAELVKLGEVVAGHGAARAREGLLEMLAADLA
mmetsp:Transcript_81054/g.238213  ORF Transcript_81054/g.238213 Transcript_81054/m.238213 type:complete len:137 (+) Transcript_81054:334-744(+)